MDMEIKVGVILVCFVTFVTISCLLFLLDFHLFGIKYRTLVEKQILDWFIDARNEAKARI